MLPSSTAIISAGVIRPVVAFKKNRVMPVVTCLINVVCIGAIVYDVVVKDDVVGIIL